MIALVINMIFKVVHDRIIRVRSMRSAHPHAAGYAAKQRVRLRFEQWHGAARSYCVGMGE